MQVRRAADTGRSSEGVGGRVQLFDFAAAGNVSSIGRLAGNNAPYERQTARLNRETARQAEIKSNPAPVIWVRRSLACRSGLANLIPAAFPTPQKKAECHSGEVAGRERGVWSGAASLNNYESGSLTFWGVNLKSTGDRGVGLFISPGSP